MNRIVFCTLRDNKGATGGPGGVLFLQKEMLGSSIVGVTCEYWFNTFEGRNKLLNIIIFFIKCMFKGDTYFFTHDIMSGWILSLLRKNYTLVYHNQGPIAEEIMNLGVKHNRISLYILRHMERSAFTNAQTLHFPSMGAADMFFDSKYATCGREEVRLVKPLYNIIPLVNPQKPKKFSLDKADDYLTFFSLGTLTLAKGQDQTIEFLAEFLKSYKHSIRYIMVGKGPLKDQLIKRLDELKREHKHFTYHYFETVSHDIVMYLHKIADIYIMLHRISIFDFATLEAMSQDSAVVLSRVGGNMEFNLDNNIVYADDALMNMDKFAKIDFNAMKVRNKQVFSKYFSKEAFRKQYEDFITSVGA